MKKKTKDTLIACWIYISMPFKLIGIIACMAGIFFWAWITGQEDQLKNI